MNPQQQINPAFARQNGPHHNGQRMQHMNGGFGGQMGMSGMGGMGMNMGMGMGVQEMMVSRDPFFSPRARLLTTLRVSFVASQLAQMAQMQFMQQQMQQFAQQGGLLPQQQQQPFSGGPQRTNGASNRSNHHSQAPRAGAPGGRASPKPYAPALAKPTDPTLCKFSLGCSNPQCPYSHPSPVATPETALVLSTEPCELQRKCKDPDCLKSHVSPASVTGEFPPARLALLFSSTRLPRADPLSSSSFRSPPGHTGPSQLPCKYQNCNNPSCPFLHTDDQGNTIPPPALTDPSLAVPHTKKDPKFASAPLPHALSKPWKAGGGGFSPYTKGKPSPHPSAIVAGSGMNKSVKFNPKAKEFVPVNPPAFPPLLLSPLFRRARLLTRPLLPSFPLPIPFFPNSLPFRNLPRPPTSPTASSRRPKAPGTPRRSCPPLRSPPQPRLRASCRRR